MLEAIHGLTELQIYLLGFGLLIQGLIIAVIPEEVVMISMGVLWAHAKVHFLPAMVAMQLGLLPANSGMVWFGGHIGRRKVLKKKSVQEALEYVRRWGGWVVFVARFTPTVRGAVYLAAGISQMRVRDFFKIDCTASFIQVPLLMYVGHQIAKSSSSIGEAYKKVGIVAGSFLALVILSIAIHEIRRKRRLATIEKLPHPEGTRPHQKASGYP